MRVCLFLRLIFITAVPLYYIELHEVASSVRRHIINDEVVDHHKGLELYLPLIVNDLRVLEVSDAAAADIQLGVHCLFL